MESVITGILFIALAVNIPIMLAYLAGLKFQIKDKTCPAEIKDVQNNILATKVIQVANVVIYAILMALSIFL